MCVRVTEISAADPLNEWGVGCAQPLILLLVRGLVVIFVRELNVINGKGWGLSWGTIFINFC